MKKILMIFICLFVLGCCSDYNETTDFSEFIGKTYYGCNIKTIKKTRNSVYLKCIKHNEPVEISIYTIGNVDLKNEILETLAFEEND